MSRDDTYQNFSIQARELLDGLTEGMRELDRGGGPARLVALLRLAHTLKGASRMASQPDIAELAHAMEDVLSPYCQAGVPVSGVSATEFLRLATDIGAHLDALEPAPSSAVARPQPGDAPALETVPVEIQEIHAVLEAVAAGGVHVRAIRDQARGLEPARRLAREALDQARLPQPNGNLCGQIEEMAVLLERLDRALTTNIQQTERQLAQLRKRAEHLRLLGVATVFPSLARSVNEATGALPKHATFTATGGDIRIDAHVLLVLGDTLAQLVDNALAHGIERPEVRLQAGKPAAGRIEVRVEWGRDGVVFACTDDGAGIDVEAIRRVAARRGASESDPGGSFELSDAIEFLLSGGIARTVTETAGCGFGLDIVRAAAARLRGRIAMESAPHRGTTVRIHVPVALASLPALLVETEGTILPIPLAAVRRCLIAGEDEFVPADSGIFLAHAGRMIPFHPLAALLHPRRPAAESRRRWTTVLVATGDHIAAIGVDRLHGMETILVRPSPEETDDALIAGTSVDAEGNPRPVLDPAGMVQAARRANPENPTDDPTRLLDPRPRVRFEQAGVSE